MTIASVSDYRELARRRLPHFLFEYIDGGAYAEVTLRRNVEDLERVALRQRVMRDVSALDLSADLFGQRYALPVALAPVGLTGAYARRGEVQAARGARSAGVPFCQSTMSICSVEEVATAAGAPWFQLYMIRDRAFMRDLLARAWAVGSRVLVFTVDLPVAGARYRDKRSGLIPQPGLAGTLRRWAQLVARPTWVLDVGLRGGPLTLGNIASQLAPRSGLEDFFGWIAGNFDPSVTWSDLDFIRSAWPGSIVIKGVLEADDALEARRAGADGLVVSNHGGRQLDGVISSARALPAIRDAIGEDLTILADGGVRSGLDVARMIALGADGVMIGRAWVHALAARGEAGVKHVMDLIEAELRVAMALTGSTTLAELRQGALAKPNGPPAHNL